MHRPLLYERHSFLFSLPFLLSYINQGIKKNGGSEKWLLFWGKTLFPYFDGFSGNTSYNYTFDFNIHDACLILRRIMDCIIRGTKKSYLLGFDISSSKLFMFFNIPQNWKQIFERKQLRHISRHNFSLLKEKNIFSEAASSAWGRLKDQKLSSLKKYPTSKITSLGQYRGKIKNFDYFFILYYF